MKKHILYSLLILLTLAACSKEEENIKPVIPITDLPCEEQGTYFLSATIGDSVLCYASDSAQGGGTYSFIGSISDLSDYYGKDTSLLYISNQYYDGNNERLLTIHYTIPIYSRYEMKPLFNVATPFYYKMELEESLNNKIFFTQNIDNTVPGVTADFYMGLTTNNYNDKRGSYFGFQDSSYIRLFNPIHIYDYKSSEEVVYSTYEVSYETQTSLYDVRGNYLYPFKAKGTFRFYFRTLN